MPSRAHQSLISLFRRDPKLAVELAARIAGRSLPDDFVVRDRQGVLQCTTSDGERTIEIDLLLTVHARTAEGRAGEQLCQVWIVEVQLNRDRGRVRAWTDYFLAVLQRFEISPSSVDMLVVSPYAPVRRWIQRHVLTRLKAQPLVLEPCHVPWLDDHEHAQRRPEAAVLSAVFHGHLLRAAGVVRAACHAIEHLETTIRDHYQYLIQTAAHEHMDIPFPLPTPSSDETPSEWEQRGLTWAQHWERIAAHGRAEGLLEGREEGRLEGHEKGRLEGREEGLLEGHEKGLLQARREALLRILGLLDLHPTSQQRQRIDRCESPAQLASWMASLDRATVLDELFEVPAPQ